MKSFSIVNLVVLTISLLCIFSFASSDITAAMGWGFIGVVFGLAYGITGTVQAFK